MKKIMPYVLALVFGNAFANAESSEIFPMSDITIGMSSKELMDKYPTEQIFFAKRNDDQSLKGGTVVYPILANKFWDSLGVVVRNEKVEGMGYSRTNRELKKRAISLSQGLDTVDYGNVIENIKPLFMQLRKELGADFEKKVVYQSFKEGRTRCAMYVWERDGNIVTFIHSPVALREKRSIFVCQVTIAPSLDYLSSEMATDSLPEDKLLWADAMGEAVSFPNRWVYACAALGALCAIAYLMRRKR